MPRSPDRISFCLRLLAVTQRRGRWARDELNTEARRRGGFVVQPGLSKAEGKAFAERRGRSDAQLDLPPD